MSEFMTLEKAFENTNSEDFLHHDIGHHFKKKDFHKQVISGKVIFDGNWQIIPAEPKVLTADELVREMLLSIAHTIENCTVESIHLDDLEKLSKSSHENGRLERDLELRPFLEKVEQLFYYICNPSAWDHYSENVSRVIADIRTEAHNLKPLEANSNNGLEKKLSGDEIFSLVKPICLKCVKPVDDFGPLYDPGKPATRFFYVTCHGKSEKGELSNIKKGFRDTHICEVFKGNT